MSDHSAPGWISPDDTVTVILDRGDLQAFLNEMPEKPGWPATGANNCLAGLRTAHNGVQAGPSTSAPAPQFGALLALAALLRDGQRWSAGRLVSSSCPSQADLCAALGWPPPWDTAWAPAAPTLTEASQDKCMQCMPHQRQACGHCPHDECQDCDRCCSCQCGQAPVLT